jgi:hypothetical protein
MENQVQQQSETSFQVGDMAVHPAHGVGEVAGIETRDLGGSMNVFYVLKIVDSGLKVSDSDTATAQVGYDGRDEQERSGQGSAHPAGARGGRRLCIRGTDASARTPRC